MTGKFRKQHDDQWIELSLIHGHQELYLSTSSSARDMFVTDEEEERPIESKNVFDDFDFQESQSLFIPEGD